VVNCPFTVTIYSPQVPSIDGFVVNACGGVFSADDLSETCSYCPTDIVPNCPLSNEKVLYSSGFMMGRKLGTNSLDLCNMLTFYSQLGCGSFRRSTIVY